MPIVSSLACIPKQPLVHARPAPLLRRGRHLWVTSSDSWPCVTSCVCWMSAVIKLTAWRPAVHCDDIVNINKCPVKVNPTKDFCVWDWWPNSFSVKYVRFTVLPARKPMPKYHGIKVCDVLSFQLKVATILDLSLGKYCNFRTVLGIVTGHVSWLGRNCVRFKHSTVPIEISKLMVTVTIVP